MGHIQVSRLIPAGIEAVYEHIADLRNVGFWLRPELDIEWPSFNDAPIPSLRERAEISFNLVRFGIALRVVVRVDSLHPGEGYTYRQVSGLFRSFAHAQHLRAHDEKTTLLTDIVDFETPLGVVGALLDDLWLKKDVERLLDARLTRIEQFFQGPLRENAEPLVTE